MSGELRKTKCGRGSSAVYRVVHLVEGKLLLTLKKRVELTIRHFYCGGTSNLMSTVFCDQIGHPVDRLCARGRQITVQTGLL